MADDGNGMEVPDGSEIPDPGDPRGRELDFGRPERKVLPDAEFIGQLPEYRIRLRPDGRWEVEVWTRPDAVLLNKISRKTAEIRQQVAGLQINTKQFIELFEGRIGMLTDGVRNSSEKLRDLHTEWLQCMDIAEQIRVSPRLIKAAMDVSAPTFHWGERE